MKNLSACIGFIFLSLILVINKSQSQSYHFKFDKPVEIPMRIDLVSVYSIPVDSVADIVYGDREVNVHTSWMQQPLFRSRSNQFDSIFRSSVVPEGYFLIVQSNDGWVNFSIRRKEAFYTVINDMRDLLLLDVRTMDHGKANNVLVGLGNNPLAYNEHLKGYILHPEDGDRLEIRQGNDIELYSCEKKRFKPYRYNNYNDYHAYENENVVSYEGYLVTNKPKYLPRDTVKYKAYLLNKKTKAPVNEPIDVSLGHYPEFKIHTINSQGPGVYYSEFVLGDSVKPDRSYELKLKGVKTNAAIGRTIVVEDYLLDETFLRVTGEKLSHYQSGDSVSLYAFAYNSNGLPVLDGDVTITVTPHNYRLKPGSKAVFLPDTLHHRTVPVNPEGDTYIGFSTQDIPELQQLTLHCEVSMTNSNFERKDTAFNIYYNADETYFRVTERGDMLRAELIKNKRSVPGKGYYLKNGANNKKEMVYPFEARLSETDLSFTFYQARDSGFSDAYIHTIAADSLEVLGSYVKDTAYFQVTNPKKVWFRYVLYKGNKCLAHGSSEGDTVLKIQSRKGETFTMLLNYMWATESRSKTATAFRIGKQMAIDVRKKDVVYPGQTDTIGIKLSDVAGNGIKNTNVTVLAFTSKFEEDHVPRLAASGYIKPGLQDVKYTRTVAKMFERQNKPGQIMSKEWAQILHVDTAFYYKHIYFNDSNIALYSFRLPDSLKTQLAIYVREGNQYVQPQAIYTGSNKLIYASMLSVSTDYQALILNDGLYNLFFRTKDSLYAIRSLRLEKGYKTNLFINADALDENNDTLIKPYVARLKIPDSLEGWERDAIARSTFLYRSETNNNFSISQGNLAFHAWNNNGFIRRYYDNDYYYEYDRQMLSFGPVTVEDSVGFFSPGYMKQRFIPELHFIYTLRPGMMRLEKYSSYDLLKEKLRLTYITPQVNKVSTPAKPFDSLVVFPPPPIQKVRKPYKEFVVMENNWVSQKGHTAGLELQLPYDRPRKAVALKLVNDTLQPFITQTSYHELSLRTKPGVYHLLILWNDTTSTVIKNLMLKANGRTILPVRFDSTRFDMRQAPQWFATSVTKVFYDTNYVSQVSYPLKGAYGSGAVSGKVLDEVKQPVIGAIIEIKQNREIKGAGVTDEDGRYTIKPLEPGADYEISVKYTGYQEVRLVNLQITGDRTTYQNFNLKLRYNNFQEVQVLEYKRPLIKRDQPGTSTTFTGDEIHKMATINTNDVAAMTGGTYQRRSGDGIHIGGARANGSLYIIDGIQTASGDQNNRGGDRNFIKSNKAQEFISDFINNMQAASGLRKNFRDWAIWQPDLWTDKDGNASFTVKYPDDVTGWKTYVLAMNPKGFSGSAFTLTRAFKPLSAELSSPRFLRYGDTVEMVGKVMNYSGQSFSLKTTFMQQGKTITSEALTVQNAKVESLLVPAPGTNTTDTLLVPVTYSIQTDNGYTDGEERTVPVYPVGVMEHKGLFVAMMRDTTVFSEPSDTSGYFTGKTLINIDGSLLEVMLHEIENLKVYPHGCTEQLTTKLLAIYYEEEVKKLLGNDTLNNAKAKREILDKLVFAQNRDGSFGWFAGNHTDYRITNYVISTLQKVNKDGWLDLIIRRGLEYLNSCLEAMDRESLIASLATLSRAGYASNYKTHMDKLKFNELGVYNQFAIVKVKKEQGFPYRNQLDTLMDQARVNPNGMSWGYHGYDWYRNDLATTLLAYQVVSDDSIYGKHKDAIIQYLLFKRKNGYYSNTAESGLVLTTLLPEIIKSNKPDANAKRETKVYISGSLKDTIRTFPAYFVVKDKKPEFSFTKDGFSPAYVSVVYEYFNKQPRYYAGAFNVRSVLLKANDTVTSLKQGEKVTLRVTVQALKDAEYVMIDMPIPAGCVQADKKRSHYYFEANRENYKDRTVVYLNALQKGIYTFDVELQARYKGNFHLNPASVTMMYYPEEYGNDVVKKVRIE